MRRPILWFAGRAGPCALLRCRAQPHRLGVSGVLIDDVTTSQIGPHLRYRKSSPSSPNRFAGSLRSSSGWCPNSLAAAQPAHALGESTRASDPSMYSRQPRRETPNERRQFVRSFAERFSAFRSHQDDLVPLAAAAFFKNVPSAPQRTNDARPMNPMRFCNSTVVLSGQLERGGIWRGFHQPS